MFEAKIEAKNWKNIISVIGSIIEEAPLRIDKDGLTLRAMDPSHISLIDLEVPKDQFIDFSVDSDRVIGIDVEEMSRVMSRGKPTDMMLIKADEDNNKLFVTFIGESRRRFGLPIIDTPEQSNLKLPDFPTNAIIGIDASLFKDGIKDASIVADHITLEAKNNSFIMRAEGDIGDIETKIEKSSLVELKLEEECKSTFNLSYLADVSSSINGPITLELGNDSPILMNFEIGGATIKFVLAPRIER
ncbi:MAG: proliferating cell nuclear antigen (pcna) [Candidatus Methanofastidiosa archaeon]|nr:proliferating cell nuclear antigen (pcna) [Candidatus Methanofastidiosa archaeon]